MLLFITELPSKCMAEWIVWGRGALKKVGVRGQKKELFVPQFNCQVLKAGTLFARYVLLEL